MLISHVFFSDHYFEVAPFLLNPRVYVQEIDDILLNFYLNKDENAHRFALSSIKGEPMERGR